MRASRSEHHGVVVNGTPMPNDISLALSTSELSIIMYVGAELLISPEGSLPRTVTTRFLTPRSF